MDGDSLIILILKSTLNHLFEELYLYHSKLSISSLRRLRYLLGHYLLISESRQIYLNVGLQTLVWHSTYIQASSFRTMELTYSS